jgi:Polyprenyl synthetase
MYSSTIGQNAAPSAVAASAATSAGVDERVLDLKNALLPIAADMRDVDGVIRARLGSDVVLINTVADYIIGAGGKRLRPAVVLLVARALGYAGSAHVLLPASTIIWNDRE